MRIFLLFEDFLLITLIFAWKHAKTAEECNASPETCILHLNYFSLFLSLSILISVYILKETLHDKWIYSF